MKVDRYTLPRSSLLSVDKDLNLILNKILSNESLKKLLYYTDRDPLSKERLNETQEVELFSKEIIRIAPKIKILPGVQVYVVIVFDSFVPNLTNPQFRDNVLKFDILCHWDQWIIKNNELRPYRIAAEIDSMLSCQRLTGIGKLDEGRIRIITQSDEFAGLEIAYYVTHGGEDKKFKLDPEADRLFIEEFNERENHPNILS